MHQACPVARTPGDVSLLAAPMRPDSSARSLHAPVPGSGTGGLPPPDPAQLERSRRLCARIVAAIERAGGWISFADYMQMALYAPGLGYYDAPGDKLGGSGDFVTAPEISPLFARALAAQISEAFARLPRRVLEFGAGTGALAHELVAELRRRGFEDVEYFILEVSADLAARQRQRLAGLPVAWLERLPDGFEGVVVANEVLDVLPVHLFVAGGGAVLERGVTAEDGALRFAGRPAPEGLARTVAAIEAEAGPWPEGYGSEICPLAEDWIAALAAHLRRGLALIVDYGFPSREYYHPQRAMGTLMCHYRQRAHADPLWLPGLNDITAHIDFSACARAARRCGLDVLGYTTQAHFLLNCGLLDLLGAAGGAPDPSLAAAAQRLVSEAEMGELVKVMALGRDLKMPAPLGFSRGDRSHRL